MSRLILAVFVALSGPAYAGYKWSGKKVDLDSLVKELAAAGCGPGPITTYGDRGEISGPSCAAHAAVLAAHDPDAASRKKAQMRGRAAALRTKAKSGTISRAEEVELLGLLGDLVLGD